MTTTPSSIEARLADLGITLPEAAPPAANYVPFLMVGDELHISGQLPMGPDGLAHMGTVGDGLSVAEGAEAARLCALNILAQAKAALGTLDRIARCIRLAGFVNAAPGFEQHPAVVNGASDLIADVLGEKGRHTRIAVGCASLPFNAAVEVEALFLVTGGTAEGGTP